MLIPALSGSQPNFGEGGVQGCLTPSFGVFHELLSKAWELNLLEWSGAAEKKASFITWEAEIQPTRGQVHTLKMEKTHAPLLPMPQDEFLGWKGTYWAQAIRKEGLCSLSSLASCLHSPGDLAIPD